jgi:hypothetical protein
MVVINKAGPYTCPADLLDRKIEFVTAELRNHQELSKGLHEISAENALIISEYIMAMKTEMNLSDNYRRDNIKDFIHFFKV